MKKTALIILCACIFLYTSLHTYDEYKYRRVIPAHINVNWIAKEKIDGFREYYGGVIFSLNIATIEKVKLRGVTFLNEDLYSREHKGKEGISPTYEKWQTGPCQLDSLALRTIIGDDKDLYKKIIFEAEQKNAFCTKMANPDLNAKLVIIPNLGIIVWQFVD